MGNKHKGRRAESVPAVNPEVPIENDPYWKVSTIFMDVHRVGRYLDRLGRLEERHPKWVSDLLEGMPTYYCVLGVRRGATGDEVRQALERQGDDPFYPVEMMTEAFSTLVTPDSQKEYDELLFLFEQYTKVLPPFEKKELARVHSENVATGKKFEQLKQAETQYYEYLLFYLMGMPDIYEIAGQKRDADAGTIQRECPQDSELKRKIYSILADPVARENYDVLFTEVEGFLTTEERNFRERKKILWSSLDRESFEKIVLLILKGDHAAEKYFDRAGEILNVNQDWKQYLPPEKESFFSVLGVDAGLIQAADKKEVEGLIRDKYRDLPKTPQVNLAYSVLKNKTLREDYLWLYETFSWGHSLTNLMNVKEEVHAKTPKKSSRHRKTYSKIPKD